MLRPVRITLLLLALLAALAPAASAAGTSLTASGVPTFPERSWILTLPRGVTLAPHDVRLRENGTVISPLQVAPADGGASRGLGVVLVIDSSQSMAGAAINDAMDAARTFAAQRSPGQKLGVVTFDNAATVVLSPTTDGAKIDAALAPQPVLHGGTHIFDAAAKGVELLRRAGGQAGAVIVLSDGSDRGSLATAQTVAAAAALAHVRVFTVGVKSARFEDATLKDLAAAASGQYLGAATGPSLARLYRDLGGQLANAYILRYRSLEPVGTTVNVSARAHGVLASATYQAPTLAVVAQQRAARRAAHGRTFLGSARGIVLVALATLLAVFLLLWVLLRGSHGGRGVRDRVRDYGAPLADPSLAQLDVPARAGRDSAPTWQSQLAEQLDIARLEATPLQFIAVAATFSLVLTWAAVTAIGSIVVAPFALGLCWLAARGVLRMRVARQRSLFADQLADSLQGVSSAMRTGHSFAGALAVLVEEAADPTATEFGRVIADERLGVPVEESLHDLVTRMDNRDVEQVALVAVLQRESGGNGAEALDRVVENLRGRDEVRRLVKSLTSQGQLTRWILTAIPVGLLVLLSALSPRYMDPLLHTSTGHALLILAVMLIVAGSLTIKRIVEIEV